MSECRRPQEARPFTRLKRAARHGGAMVLSTGLVAGCADMCGTRRDLTPSEVRVAERQAQGETIEGIRNSNIALFREASVEVAIPRHSPNPNTTIEEFCKGTHIGEGMILTVRNCIVEPDRLKNLPARPYHVATLVGAYTVRGFLDGAADSGPVGQTDTVVIYGNADAPNLAIMYAPGAERLKSIQVEQDLAGDTPAKAAPGRYVLTAHPDEQYRMKYEPMKPLQFSYKIDNPGDPNQEFLLKDACNDADQGAGMADIELGVLHGPVTAAAKPFGLSRVCYIEEATPENVGPLVVEAA